jgi:hypothetical protein
LANLCAFFHWDRVSVISTTDLYGTSISERFINSATALGIKILSIQTFPRTFGSHHYDELVRSAIALTRDSNSKVILLLLVSLDLQVYFRIALEMGFVGEPLTYVFTDGGTTTATNTSLFLSTDANFTNSLIPYTNGWIRTSPTLPSGPLWDAFVEEWVNADPQEYPGSASSMCVCVCVCVFLCLPLSIYLSLYLYHPYHPHILSLTPIITISFISFYISTYLPTYLSIYLCVSVFF